MGCHTSKNMENAKFHSPNHNKKRLSIYKVNQNQSLKNRPNNSPLERVIEQESEEQRDETMRENDLKQFRDDFFNQQKESYDNIISTNTSSSKSKESFFSVSQKDLKPSINCQNGNDLQVSGSVFSREECNVLKIARFGKFSAQNARYYNNQLKKIQQKQGKDNKEIDDMEENEEQDTNESQFIEQQYTNFFSDVLYNEYSTNKIFQINEVSVLSQQNSNNRKRGSSDNYQNNKKGFAENISEEECNDQQDQKTYGINNLKICRLSCYNEK